MQHQVGLPCNKGITLLQVLGTLSILAILAAVGLPAFSALHARHARDSAAERLADHIRVARSEAVKRQRRIIICNSVNLQTCSVAGNTDWSTGWIIFQDSNASGTLDPNEPVILTIGAPAGIKGIRPNTQIRRLVFLPNGLMAAGMGTFSVIPAQGSTRLLIISRIGRVRSSLAE